MEVFEFCAVTSAFDLKLSEVMTSRPCGGRLRQNLKQVYIVIPARNNCLNINRSRSPNPPRSSGFPSKRDCEDELIGALFNYHSVLYRLIPRLTVR